MTLSPDGNWLWNGTEWIPAPPTAAPATGYNSTTAQSVEATKATTSLTRPIDVQNSLESVKEYCLFVEEYILKNTKSDRVYGRRKIALICSIIGWILGYVAYVGVFINYSDPHNGNGISLLALVILILLSIPPLILERGLRRHLDTIFPNGSKLVRGSWTGSHKALQKSFIQHVAIYDYLLAAVGSLNDFQLRGELVPVQSTLEQLKAKLRSREVRSTIIQSAAAGAVAYGVARKFSKK